MQFVKFHTILWNCCLQIPHILQPVGIVVLTDNTSKYNKFIVTWYMKTHYIKPLMMKIRVIIVIIITKVSLQRLHFVLQMVKLKRSPKHLDLDVNVAKNGQFRILPRQAANSMAQHENPHSAEYCWPCWWSNAAVIQLWHKHTMKTCKVPNNNLPL